MSIVLDRPSTTAADREQRAELVRRAAELVPLQEKNAGQTEDDRRVAEDNIAAIERAGLFKIMQPKRYGGMEVDFRTKGSHQRACPRLRVHRLDDELDQRVPLVRRHVERAGAGRCVG
jgi:alkylation response protein AidB-like acyl-CoA dehydrogenase